MGQDVSLRRLALTISVDHSGGLGCLKEKRRGYNEKQTVA